MRRISFWVLSTLSAVVLLFSYHTSTSGPTGVATSQHAIVSGSNSTAGTSGTSGKSGKSAGSTSGSTTGSSARTVTGSVAPTEWGPVQVELTVSGAKITKVSVLQYPSGNGRDDEINSYALPILINETMDAQSANVDMVSGATVTSGGYLQSLQSALDQANL